MTSSVKLHRASQTAQSSTVKSFLDSQSKNIPVVAIIAGTGGYAALATLLDLLPTKSGAAFVINAPQVVGKRARRITELQGATSMPLHEVTTNLPLQTDQIYMVGAENVRIEGDQLCLFSASDKPTEQPIDDFLASLAAERGVQAIAMVLAGRGGAGVAGLGTIKASDGWVMVQSPAASEQPALPKRAIASQQVDVVGTLEELSSGLADRLGYLTELAARESIAQADETEIFAAILEQIQSSTGHDFTLYKRSTLLRRMARRMQIGGFGTLAAYAEYLQNSAAETHALYRDCLVSVTNFFRDPDAFDMLERDCVPKLFDRKSTADTVRAWIVGCATGEEAYSVAMLLIEQVGRLTNAPRVQVFASDIDEEAINFARRGLYPATIVEDIPAARLQRFFISEEQGYRVRPEVREQVLFTVHNVLKAPPFSKLDLITCRNLLIYLDREAHQKLFDLFHYALNPNGYLFLGSAESADIARQQFTIRDKRCHLYQRRELAGTNAIRRWPPQAGALGNQRVMNPASNSESPARTVEQLYQAWTVRHYGPPRMLIDKHYEITHLFSGADRYLREREGAVTQHILQKILPVLRPELRAALYQAFAQGEHSQSRWLRVEINGRIRSVRLHVGPVDEPGMPKPIIEIVFLEQEEQTPPLSSTPAGDDESAHHQLVQRLEDELMRTRERLQSIIEEHESANQALVASNEELQSINEELRSTSEELEINKEELQSMNEELVTVNYELKLKIDELSRSNSDLMNLISATDVGTIFLDRRLRIKRFTPLVTDLFHLIESDIGRPLAHVAHRLRHRQLPALLQHLLETQKELEEIVESDESRWYLMRLLPYRTIDNEVDGVVVTFTDISDLRRAEHELQQRIQQQVVADLGRQALLDTELPPLMNTAVERLSEALSVDLGQLLLLQPDQKTLQMAAGHGWRPGYVEQTTLAATPDLQVGFTLHAHSPVFVKNIQDEERFGFAQHLLDHQAASGLTVPIPGPQQTYGVLGVYRQQPHEFTDYDADFLQAVANLLGTAIARQQAEQRVYFQASLLDTVEQAVIATDLKGKIIYWNRFAETLYGWSANEVIGLSIMETIILPQRVSETEKIMEHLVVGEHWKNETILRNRKGETFPAYVTDAPIYDERGTQIGIVGVSFDISERKISEENLRSSEQLLQGSIDALTSHIAILDQDGVILKVNASWRQFAESNQFLTDNYGIGSNYVEACRPDLLPPAECDPHGLEAGAGIVAVSKGEVPSFTMEYPCHSPTEQRWFVMRVTRFGEEDELRLVVAHENVTERKIVEQALRASEAELRLITNTVPGLIAYVDSEQRYRFVNATYERWFGHPSQALIGKRVIDLLDADGYENARVHIEAALAGQLVTFENRVQYADYPRTVLSTYVPAQDEWGQVAGFYALTTDISELKEYEAELTQLNETLERRVEERTTELERSNRELDQFAYVASHDLKAPLRGIAQLATWISEDVGDELPATTHEHLQKLHGRVRRMSTLLDDLLAYSRVGRLQHAPESLPLVSFIQDIVETLSPPANFVVKVESKLAILQTERVPLEIALRNLIGNAIKHHERSNGIVEVRIQQVGEQIHFAVQDDGPGIDPKFHERIFELFQTLQPRDRVEGSGMGLAIVKKLIESRGGAITVESTPGRGATFSFTWPLTSVETAPSR